MKVETYKTRLQECIMDTIIRDIQENIGQRFIDANVETIYATQFMVMRLQIMTFIENNV